MYSTAEHTSIIHLCVCASSHFSTLIAFFHKSELFPTTTPAVHRQAESLLCAHTHTRLTPDLRAPRTLRAKGVNLR